MKRDNCLELLKQNENYVMKNLQYFPLVIKEAHGSILTDDDDNKFIDFLSSASSLNLGSSNPVIVKAEQSENI